MNNLETIQKLPSFLELETNIKEAVKESKSIMVFTEADIEKAGFYIKKFKQLEKKLESLRKEQGQPYADEKKRIDDFFKSQIKLFSTELERLNKDTDELLKEIRQRQEAERLKEQKELEDATLKEAEIFDDPSVIDDMPQIEFKKTGLSDISSSLTTVRKKDWRITDFSLVPREWLIIDSVRMDEERKKFDFDEPSQIPGIEFFTTEKARVK